MTNNEQPRQPSGAPTSGRWVAAPHPEPTVDLHTEALHLSIMAEQLSKAYGVATMSPDVIAMFARRVLPFVTEQPAAPPVAAPSPYEAADYTINSRDQLPATIAMATQNAIDMRLPQTIDFPGDSSWLRASVDVGGFHGGVPISAPYGQSLESLVAATPPVHLVSAGLTLCAWVGTDRTLMHAAARHFDATEVARAEAVLTAMVTQNLDGKNGAIRDILALTPQSTAGYRELADQAH